MVASIVIDAGATPVAPVKVNEHVFPAAPVAAVIVSVLPAANVAEAALKLVQPDPEGATVKAPL